MSTVNNRTAIAAIPVMANPQPRLPPNNQPSNPQQRNGPRCHPVHPYINLTRLRDVERRARREISLIEHNARVAARSKHPMESLPRTESNVRSVKRTRQWRKGFEVILTEQIYAKVERNRQLAKLIEIEKEKDRRLTAEIPELEKLPDIPEDLVQVEEEVTPDQFMNDFITSLDPDKSPEQPAENRLTDNDFDLGGFANALIDCRPYAGAEHDENDSSAGFEPTLNPEWVLQPLSDDACLYAGAEHDENDSSADFEPALNSRWVLQSLSH